MKKIIKKLLILIKEFYPFIIVIVNADLFIQGASKLTNYDKSYFILFLRTIFPLIIITYIILFLSNKKERKEQKLLNKKHFILNLIGGFFTGVAQFFLAVLLIRAFNDWVFDFKTLISALILFVLLFIIYFLKRLKNKSCK